MSQPSISRLISAIIGRDIRAAWQTGGGGPLTMGFFLAAVSVFPFAIGSDADILARTGAGLIWVAAFFATLLSFDRLFQMDYDDGTLSQYLLSPLHPLLLVLAKATAHWLAIQLPLLLAAPLAAIMLQLGSDHMTLVMLALALGSPALSLIGALAAALTVAIKRGGALITLLVLPLFLPTLIFGASSSELLRLGQDPMGALMILGGISLITLVIAPAFAVMALKLAQE